MRTALSLGALAALQLSASLVGQLAILRIVGVGAESDAFVAAQTVPLVLTAVVAASMQSLWLPRFVRTAHDPQAFLAEQAIAQGQALKFLLGISLILALTASFWARLAFPGFTAGQIDQVVVLGVPLLAACVLGTQTGLLTVALRAKGKFVRAEMITLAGGLAGIGLIFALVPRFGIVAASWAALIRAALVYVIQLFMAGLPGVVLRPSEPSRKVWSEMRPLIGAAMFIKTGPLVDRFWSSQAGSGAVTTFSLAQLGMNSLAAILERAILVRATPEFARRLLEQDYEGMRRHYLSCLRRTAVAVLAITAILLALVPMWNDLLRLTLKMEAQQARQILVICLILIPILFVSIGGSAAAAVFFAFGETRLPTVIGIWGFLAGLVFKAVLFMQFGIYGLAGGLSLYVLLVMLLYHVAVRRRFARAMSATTA